MTDYYDGPRGGVADFMGRPHIYRSLWADIDHERADVFELAPIDDQTLALALEDWQIWPHFTEEKSPWTLTPPFRMRGSGMMS